MEIYFFFDDEVVPFENEIALVEGEVVPKEARDNREDL